MKHAILGQTLAAVLAWTVVIGLLSIASSAYSQTAVEPAETKHGAESACSELLEDERLACMVELAAQDSEQFAPASNSTQPGDPCEKKGGRARIVACGIGQATESPWGRLILAFWIIIIGYWFVDKIRSP